MDREKAWTHYFKTGDREPLVKAYWNSVRYIAWSRFPDQEEDMFQVGMIGLLKGIDRIDPKRVKSKDAWIFLNVRGMILNITQPKKTESLNEMLNEDTEFLEMLPAKEEDTDFEVDDILSCLPPREARIIKLVHVEQYKRTEVAKMFGVSSMRIGQLEKRALDKLKSCAIVV